MKRFFYLLLLVLPGTAFGQSEAYFRPSGTGLTASELTLVQSGHLNQTRVQDTGQGNAVRVSQVGTGNALGLDVSGTGSQFTFRQWGDHNIAEWCGRPQRVSTVEVLQRGNHNLLIQDGSTPAAGVSMRIEQTGGMQLILKAH